MEFPEIVSMIDADLELLRKVRQLLAPSSPLPSSGIQKTVKSNRKRATQIELGFGGLAIAEAETAKAPEVIESKEQKHLASKPSLVSNAPVAPVVVRKSPHKRQSERAPETSALRGSVPMGPVFVPAQAGPPKGRSSAVAQSSVAVMPPALTAEALARQWLSRENA
jgi:hypothetical protein